MAIIRLRYVRKTPGFNRSGWNHCADQGDQYRTLFPIPLPTEHSRLPVFVINCPDDENTDHRR